MFEPRRSCILITLLALAGIAPRAQAAAVTLGTAKDNTLYESTTGALSSGSGPHLLAGRTGQAQFSRRRGILAFDIAGSVPAGATITGVSLALNVSQTGAGPKSVALHVALADWGEGASDATANPGGGAPAQPGDATWIHRFSPSSLWTAAGGDFAAVASAATIVNAVGPYSWTSPGMVADVQGWLDLPATNFGWVVLGDEATSGTSKRFDARENPVEAARPALTVEYTLPAVPGESRPTRIALGALLAAALGFALWRRAVRAGS